MKKIILLLMIIIICSACSNRKENIAKKIEIDLENCSVIKEKDTHGGFLGDGDYFAKIECSKLELSDHWNDLPFSENIQKLLKLESCDNTSCQTVLERYQIPKIENGSYFFLDRHSSSTNPYDDSLVHTRASYNYSLAIYDKNSKTIYYYELDT